jgi:hypothetical protein
MGAGARLVPFFLPMGVDPLPIYAFSRDSKKQNGCVFPSTAASLASKSAVLLPGISQCRDIHYSRIDVPWVLVFLAACRMA